MFACSHVGLSSRTRASKCFLPRRDRMCLRLLGTHPHRHGSALPSPHKSRVVSVAISTRTFSTKADSRLETAVLERPYRGSLVNGNSGTCPNRETLARSPASLCLASQGYCEIGQAEMGSSLGQCWLRRALPSPLRALLPPLWGSLCPPSWRLRGE